MAGHDEQDPAFDAWLRSEALTPPPAPADEWQAIQAAIAADEAVAAGQPIAADQSAATAQKAEANLWSLTWPSLIAAAIPLAFALWGSTTSGTLAPYLAPVFTTGTTATAPASPAPSAGAAEDDQLWLSAGDGSLDVVMSDGEPLFSDPSP